MSREDFLWTGIEVVGLCWCIFGILGLVLSFVAATGAPGFEAVLPRFWQPAIATAIGAYLLWDGKWAFDVAEGGMPYKRKSNHD
jgi:hypothetical protein